MLLVFIKRNRILNHLNVLFMNLVNHISTNIADLHFIESIDQVKVSSFVSCLDDCRRSNIRVLDFCQALLMFLTVLLILLNVLRVLISELTLKFFNLLHCSDILSL